jgi:hypothetical protein
MIYIVVSSILLNSISIVRWSYYQGKSLSAQVFLDKNTGNIYFLNSPNHFPPFSTIFYSMSLSLSLSLHNFLLFYPS